MTNAIFYGVSPDAGGSFDKAQARAAARLMLAAPALLAELHAIIAVCPECNGKGYYTASRDTITEEEFDEHCPWCCNAREIIEVIGRTV